MLACAAAVLAELNATSPVGLPAPSAAPRDCPVLLISPEHPHAQASATSADQCPNLEALGIRIPLPSTESRPDLVGTRVVSDHKIDRRAVQPRIRRAEHRESAGTVRLCLVVVDHLNQVTIGLHVRRAGIDGRLWRRDFRA
jgi:hypothetical protein